MKITDTQHGQIPNSLKEKSGAGRGEEGRFQKIMDQVASRDLKGAVVQGAPGMPVPGGVQIIQGLERPAAVHSLGAKDMLLGEIRETLDMVERYAANLGNVNMRASDMKPLVEHLQGRLESLRRTEANPELPEKLRAVVSELVLTIGTETARFGRGDYE